jgi:hypothetical protein
LAAFAPSHGTAQDRTDEGASIRFVHASPDAGAIDVIADGAVVAENVAFGSATDYLAMPSGKHQVQIVPTGSTAESAVLDEEVDLDGGGAYIFAAAGLLNDLQSKLYEVDLDDLDENQARVRLIHLAPDQDNIDLAISGGDELQDDVDFPNASDYDDIDAGTYDLDVREHDGDAVVASAPGTEIQAARAYDILLLGQASADNLSTLILETRVSPACGDVLGIGSDDDGCVRILNASPDSSGLDVYVNDTLVVENLGFGDSTEFTALPADDESDIKITATGGSIDSPMVDDQIDIDAGQAYELIALNNADDLEIATKDVDLSPVPADQARLRVIGASENAPDFSVEITDGPELFDGIGFKDDSDNTVVDASTYDIQFKDGDDVLARVEGFEVAANTTYDLVMIGDADQGTLQVIALSAPTASIEGANATPASTPGTEGGQLAETATPDVLSTPGQ